MTSPHTSTNTHEAISPLHAGGTLPGALMAILAVWLLLTACNGGARTTLVNDPPPTAEPALELDLPPAPAGTQPLPPASADFPLESSVDDALITWANDRAIPYRDSCSLVVPGPGELCDSPTERDTVRLLGPSPDEIWYIVTVFADDSFDFGTGYRVSSVEVSSLANPVSPVEVVR